MERKGRCGRVGEREAVAMISWRRTTSVCQGVSARIWELGVGREREREVEGEGVVGVLGRTVILKIRKVGMEGRGVGRELVVLELLCWSRYVMGGGRHRKQEARRMLLLLRRGIKDGSWRERWSIAMARCSYATVAKSWSSMSLW